MYVIAVEFVVAPDDAGAFRERVEQHARNSRGEPGCLRFEVAEDEARPGRFLIWEIYRDKAAFEAHTRQPYLARFRDATAPIVQSRELSKLTMVSA